MNDEKVQEATPDDLMLMKKTCSIMYYEMTDLITATRQTDVHKQREEGISSTVCDDISDTSHVMVDSKKVTGDKSRTLPTAERKKLVYL